MSRKSPARRVDYARAEADLFRYDEPEVPAAAPAPVPAAPAPKPPKAPKQPPAPVVKPHPDHGFVPSTIEKAMTTWQPKGSVDQLRAHLGKHAGAMEEAGHTGLFEALSGKPSVTRDEVLGHIGKNKHDIVPVAMTDGKTEWVVRHSDGYHHSTHDTEEEAQEEADRLNQDEEDDFRNSFDIGTQESYKLGDIAESLLTAHADDAINKRLDQWTFGLRPEDGQWEAIPPESDPLYEKRGKFATFGSEEKARDAARRTVRNMMLSGLDSIIDSEYGDSSELEQAIIDHAEKHDLPEELVDQLTDAIEASEKYFVQSPYGGRQHDRYFSDLYDTEDEAQEAIDDHVGSHFEPPYIADSEESEGEPKYEDWVLGGDYKGYDESFITIPTAKHHEDERGKPLNERDFTYKVLPTEYPGISLIEVMNKAGDVVSQAEARVAPEEADDEAKSHVANYVYDANQRTNRRNNRIGRQSKWTDGHSDYDHVKNPVVRLRHNNRKDVNGKRLFFVEEFQGPQDRMQEDMPDWLKKRIYDIGLKNALHRAAAGPYDSLAWTTGEQQQKRYSLRNQVSELKWQRFEPNRATLVGKGKDGKEVRKDFRLTHDGWVDYYGGSIDDYLTKDVTNALLRSPAIPMTTPAQLERVSGRNAFVVTARDGTEVGEFADYDEALKAALAAGTPSANERYHVLSGDAIPVGGYGLGNLYDRDLVRRAEKLIKKHGGKVTRTAVETDQDEPEAVWNIEMTPQLRKAILEEGHTLYRRRGQPKQYAAGGDLMAMIRRLPPRAAATVALGILTALSLEPQERMRYSVQDLAYLEGLVRQWGPGKQ